MLTEFNMSLKNIQDTKLISVSECLMRMSAHLCLTSLSAPLRSACFSMLSMDSLLARLAFLQAVWLLQNTQKWSSWRKKQGHICHASPHKFRENINTKIRTHTVHQFTNYTSQGTVNDITKKTLPEHLFSVPLYLTDQSLLVWLLVLLLGHLL